MSALMNLCRLEQKVKAIKNRCQEEVTDETDTDYQRGRLDLAGEILSILDIGPDPE